MRLGTLTVIATLAVTSCRLDPPPREVEDTPPAPPPLPLPARDGTPVTSVDDPVLERWAERNMVEAYARSGRTDPRWDDAARDFIRLMARQVLGMDVDASPNQRSDAARAIGETGCDDPLVTYLRAMALYSTDRDSLETLALFEASVEGMRTAAYPRAVARYAASGLRRYLNDNRFDAWRVRPLEALELQWFLASIGDGSFQKGDDLVLVTQLTSGTGDALFEKSYAPIVAAVEGADWLAPWTRRFVSGLGHMEKAGQARGYDYASNVTEAQWRAFHRSNEAAYRDLIAAWEASPGRPEIATALLSLAMGTESPDGATERTWFDRAVALRFDYMLAYWRYVNSLRARWGGGERALLDFGKDVLATERFDTSVPYILSDALEWIQNDGAGSSRIFGTGSEACELLFRMCQGYLDSPDARGDHDFYRARYAIAAYECGQHELALSQLEAIELDVPPQLVRELTGLDVETFVTRTAALGSAGGALVAEAEALVDAESLEAALARFREALRAARHPAGLRYIRGRITMLETELALEGGEWVAVMPKDATLAGWIVEHGSWRVERDGSLVATNDSQGFLLRSLARIGPRFEVRGTIEAVTPGDYEAGIGFGDVGPTRFEWIGYRLERSERRGAVAHLARRFFVPKEVVAVELGERNRFRVESDGGRIRAYMGDALVLENTALPAAIPVGPGAVLGLGGFHEGRAFTVRYRDLELRRLGPGRRQQPRPVANRSRTLPFLDTKVVASR